MKKVSRTASVAPDAELALYSSIRSLVLSARNTVARGVDLVQVRTNFEIGRHIVEYEQQGEARAAYGKELLALLAERLTAELGKGFGRSNIAHARRPIVQTASGQSERQFSLSWSHYVFLLGIKKTDERDFYEIEATSQDWTVRELKRQFDSGLYERLALSRDKDGIRQLAQQGQIVSRPQDLLKEPLVLELGKGFLFEARQKRFTFDDDHFFVDLVFYNRLLRCYGLIDLKIGKLTHQDLGQMQMQMYVNYFDRHVKTDAESATIGILLCKKKHEALVEITLPKDANIHAREYQLYLPSKEELRQKLAEWAAELPGGTAPRN